MEKSQSRYGIMEELNSKKLTEKQRLAQLELNKESSVIQRTEAISILKKQLDSYSSIYKLDHKQWMAKKKNEKQMLVSKHKRDLEDIEESMKTEEETYEDKFKIWKQGQESKIALSESELKDFVRISDRQIKAIIEAITEIDEGIKNLKDISKEQGAK